MYEMNKDNFTYLVRLLRMSLIFGMEQETSFTLELANRVTNLFSYSALFIHLKPI